MVFLFQKDKLSFFEQVVDGLIIFGIMMAIGTYIQFFISPTIFGLTYNDIYGQDLSERVNITKRAISFISSPQSLALFLAITSILSLKIKNIMKKLSVFLFISTAGVLTFSKVFILIIFSYFLFYRLSKLTFKNFIVFILILIVFVFLISELSNTNRAFEIFNILLNITQHVTFLVWMDFLNYDTTFLQVIFGHGLGLVSRAAQSYGNYHILNGSAESFLLQIYFEIGLVGLILFLILFINAFIKYIKLKQYKHYAVLLISLFPCLLGTPAFYGLTSGFILSFFIVASVFVSKKNKQYRAIKSIWDEKTVKPSGIVSG
ncbi:MAG: hypothetical protein QM490_01180 [Candidatus Gracilibacteria bacterium]